MKPTKKHLALAIGAGILALTGTSWAGTTATVQPTVTVASVLEGGRVATVTPVRDSFTVRQGKEEKIGGYQLFQIDLGSPRFSDAVTVEVLLLNPADLQRVLKDKKAYIDVAIAYQNRRGSITLSDGTKVSKDDNATAMLNGRSGAVVLQPTVPGVNRYYVLATIATQGNEGQPSAEQQWQLTQLRFHSDVRL